MFGESFFPFGFSLILIIVFAGLFVLYKSLRERNQFRLRELIHQERIAAMQTNQPVPDLPVIGPELGAPNSNRSVEHGVLWLRLGVLLMGLFFFTTGVGMLIAFTMVDNSEANEFWALGFLPIFAGFGLLLFYALSAAAARREKTQGDVLEGRE